MPDHYTAPVSHAEPALVVKFIGALAASATAGAYVIGGAEFMDFATSFTGGLGAAVGYTVGCYMATKPDAQSPVTKLKEDMDGDYVMLYPIAGAVAVPALASGALDTDVAILAAGAFAGGYLVNYYYKN